VKNVKKIDWMTGFMDYFNDKCVNVIEYCIKGKEDIRRI